MVVQSMSMATRIAVPLFDVVEFENTVYFLPLLSRIALIKRSSQETPFLLPNLISDRKIKSEDNCLIATILRSKFLLPELMLRELQFCSETVMGGGALASPALGYRISPVLVYLVWVGCCTGSCN